MSLNTLETLDTLGSLAYEMTGLLPGPKSSPWQRTDMFAAAAMDPIAAGLQILASRPELIPTLPGFQIPGFDAFGALAQLVGADPGKHVEMVHALEAFRGQISDKISQASLQCAATAATLTRIAMDVVNKGVRVLGASAVLGPVGVGIAVATLIKEALQRAKQELDRLEAALGGLAAELASDTQAALAVTVPGGSTVAQQAMAELQRHAGNALGATVLAAPSEPPTVNNAAAYAEPTPAAGAPSAAGAAAAEIAKSQVGTPYSWGGSAPGGFDCSGLTSWAYHQAGVEIPRVAADQRVGRQVSYEELAPGDLVVWSGHVAMYTGDGMMVEAGSPVQMNPVRTDNIGMPFMGFWRPTG
ncbi:C40 family peptidase [Corynebacterium sp. HMSC29G08]|uniref:C40 family peptidase n=1 Tax=Corynebacterium sp. HMSC29G08 TaxID=1581069 RepID=UPI000AB04933|nr:C40 family peptidase [Corynebacterium sp. HMSC29G08]